ncbi:MAG: ATPase synthesis protein 25 mitochondrial [Phylliscum demangeonii]|nr:MAG: ATPase synthesis protein 25 mitochondrial [Phylliscum demangeonii]
MPVALEPEEDQLLRLIDAGEYPKASRMINRFYSHLPSDDRKGLELRAMTNSVLNLPREEAVAVLGKGISDYVSTPFLQSFYNLFPPSPSAIFWHWRVKLCSIALKHGSPGYKSIDLVHLLRQMLLSDVDILEETLLTMLEANLCHARHELALPLDAEFFDKRRQNLTRDVLDDMESRGFQVYNEDIFVMLHEALGTATPVQPPTWIEHHYVFKSPLPPHLPATASLPDPHHRRIRCQLDRLQSLMNHEAVTIMRDDNRIRVLTILANVAYWDSFWDFWAIPAREMLPRSPALYEAMFSIVARTRHQDMCCHTLRARIPEMNSETPAVPLTGPLARAVMRCLAYAEPNIEHDAATTPSLRGEWVRLWRRCEAGLSEETAVGDGDDEDVDDDDDNDDGDDDRLLQRTTATGAQLGDATPSRAGPDVQYV